MRDEDLSRSAAETFTALGSYYRVAILEALARRGEPMQFSELMEALGVSDSGQLNYHLTKLTGDFVEHRGDTYELTIQGAKITSSILASRYVREDVEYSVAVDGTCTHCGARDLVLEQVGQQAIVRCRSCNRRRFRKGATTGLWDERPPDEVPAALDRIAWAEIDLATGHVCPFCHSAMTPRVAENDWESELYDIYDLEVLAVYDCDLCTNWKQLPHGLVAWRHPEVRSFHRDHDIDPDTRRCWEIEQATDERYLSVERDPYEVEVRFPLDVETCSVTFDERNEIVQVTRE